MKNVGKRLKKVREATGLSQRELARASGVSQAMISQTEAGHKEGGLRTLEKLAHALGITFETLYSPESEGSPDPGLLRDELVYEIAQTVKPMTVQEKRKVLRFSKSLRGKR